ncbi:MAG: DUF2914 domain-containing protein [Candidatus Rokubacteria bacterium]|nr:DUF2914 domain-containing protein [Candidatus Rokubacteria bacterium]MBI3825116.1 DUF2914 domain-containing protein [Candidatus Rokubacteria bacterium]
MSRALVWARRWGVSLASLVGGLVTLFVFRRGLPNVGWIVGYLLLLWLLVALVAQLREALEARGHRFVLTAADYTIQSLYHGILLFLLPPYYAATTLGSGNVVFLLVLVALALLVTFDPWYRLIVHPRRWLRYAFFLVSIFAALNVALPLVGVPPYPSLVASAFVAMLALAPAVRHTRQLPWRGALEATATAGLVAAVLVALAPGVIPPAPLTMARATLARGVAGSEPIDPLGRTLRAAEVRNGLVAFTAVYAPAGLRQPIEHVWRRNGQVMQTVRLSPVLGGRREGFRTYSRKTSFPADPVGDWCVDVMTSSGQLIGRLCFAVTA